MTNDAQKPQSKRTPHPLLAGLGILLVTALITFGFQYWLDHSHDHGGHSLSLNEPVPEFELHPLGEKPIPFSSINAKVIVINFWATWCQPCVAEMPSLVELRKRYRDKGLEVIAISVDENPQEAVPQFSKRLKIQDFPFYADPGQKLSTLFDVEVLPLTVILDKSRQILLIERGDRNWVGPEILSRVEKWLSL